MFFCGLETNHGPFKKTRQSVKNLSPGNRFVFQDFLTAPAPCSPVQAAVVWALGGLWVGPGGLLLVFIPTCAAAIHPQQAAAAARSMPNREALFGVL